MARGVRFGRKSIDKVGCAGRASQRRDVIAPVEIPFEVRAMADAEDDVGIGERRFQ